MKLGIGIDTGGTYTDAVVFDFENKKILGSAKSLTTKNDLTIGILGAVDNLPSDLVRRAEVISLSTTLATNACVENKGGRAKLIFFGANEKTINVYGGSYGLPPAKEILIQDSFTNFSGEIEREPDWELFSRETESGFENLDGVGIIDMSAVRNGAVIEKKAKALFQEKHSIPVVCGHELFSELNSLQRGASTLLNAGLFPVISDFLDSVKKALAVRNINPSSIVIVRSDGTLMSEEFASVRPVETLLCGPAASAIGCTHFADSKNSIVVDMGGTTTDIAFIKDGSPVTVTDGVSIGKWKTFVSGLYVKTFGLGGDTAIHYDGNTLYLEDYRIIPLCVAAKKYPSVVDKLKNLTPIKYTRFLYEFYVLIKDIEESPRYTETEKKFCRALKKEPLLINEAAEAVGMDIYTLDVDRLIKDGVVQICGLTPTDVMHIKGDFNVYDAQASRLGAEFAAFNLDISVEAFCDSVYDEVKQKLYLNIVKSILENKYPDYIKNGICSDVERFILDTYAALKSGCKDPLISTIFSTEYTLIGVGAPIGVFLDDVAKMLGTHALIPDNHEVANALGAIIAGVDASYSVKIKPSINAEGESDYIVYGIEGNVVFGDLDDAIKFASSQAEKGACAEAENRGVTGELTVTTDVYNHESEANDCIIYLETIVTAHATGIMNY